MRASSSVLVAMLLFAATASAAPHGKKAACVAAHEDAQTLRTQKKFHAAREKYVECARSECPIVLRKECTEQIEQTEAAAPTIAVEARGENGASDSQVKVTLDGQVVAERLTGAAIAVEPGEHVVRVDREGKTIEQRVLVVEGEKNRKVVADFQTLVPKKKVEEPPRPVVVTNEKRVPVPAWVALGVTAVGLGSFAFFSLSGKNTEDGLADRCAPGCTADEVSPVKRDYLIADVSLGIAIVAAAAAVVFALPALTGSPKAASRGGPHVFVGSAQPHERGPHVFVGSAQPHERGGL